MARFVLDGLPLVVRSAGIATYVRELTTLMAAGNPEHSFALFQPAPFRSRSPAAPRPANLTDLRSWAYPLVMGYPARWMPSLLSLESAVGAADLFHGTTYTIPRYTRAATVTTVHDLALLRHPELGNKDLVDMVEAAARNFERADRIIAVSDSTRTDLIELCAVAPEKIRVVHNGLSPVFRPPRDATRSPIDSPYILHVGTHEPRKNIVNLLHAFSMLRAGSEVVLVQVGGPGWETVDLHGLTRKLGVDDRVRFLGAVEPSELPSLYAHARVFVYPSLYEGFGLPILEAMACGTPVVCSNRPALPEVAGDAAITVDPQSPEAIAEAIDRVLSSDELHTDMGRRGLSRAKAFSWSKCARETIGVYGELVELGHR